MGFFGFGIFFWGFVIFSQCILPEFDPLWPPQKPQKIPEYWLTHYPTDFSFAASHAIPPEKVAEMQAKIEAEKAALQAKTDMAEEERNAAAKELEKREKDILQAQ